MSNMSCRKGARVENEPTPCSVTGYRPASDRAFTSPATILMRASAAASRAGRMLRSCCVEPFSHARKPWKCLGICCTVLQD